MCKGAVVLRPYSHWGYPLPYGGLQIRQESQLGMLHPPAPTDSHQGFVANL